MKLLSQCALICLLSISIVSCSSDDDNNTATNQLLGDWRMDAYTYEGVSTTTNQYGTVTSDYTGEAINIDFLMTFAEDPNTVTGAGSYDIRLTTTTLGQTIVQEVPATQGFFSATGEWSRSGNTITMSNQGQDQEYLIEELSDSKLTLSSSASTSVITGGGLASTSLDLILEFSR